MNRAKHLYERTRLITSFIAVALVLATCLCTGDLIQISRAQSKNTHEGNPPNDLLRMLFDPIPVAADRTNTTVGVVILDDSHVTLRRISLKPHSSGAHYSHPGGYIMLLNDFAFDIVIPLGEAIRSHSKAGEIFPVAAGSYELTNATDQPLDLVSIEVKVLVASERNGRGRRRQELLERSIVPKETTIKHYDRAFTQ